MDLIYNLLENNIEELKKIEDLISLHGSNNSNFMLSQYEIKKKEIEKEILSLSMKITLDAGIRLETTNHLLDKINDKYSLHSSDKLMEDIYYDFEDCIYDPEKYKVNDIDNTIKKLIEDL